MSENVKFVNIIEPRNTQFGIYKFMTRPWYPKKSFERDTTCTPAQLKELVARSSFMDMFTESLSINTGVPKERLMREVKEYLEEVGLERRLNVIRWMGILFLKVSFMMKIAVFVNEPAILKIREQMGKNPVLFLPSHRSYADFCVLSYICYHYDIELPAVAAGLDFNAMAVIGQRMRETGAFFIRRTMVGAPLYSAMMKQYIRTVVTKYHVPIEFFLEGTRSRANKLLSPKHGMLAMTLTPYFTGEVADITIVPINISYDRVVEESLFAYEHIGVPKPKESTGKLIKAIRNLNDSYGNIYVNFATPISVKEFLMDKEIILSGSPRPTSFQGLTAAHVTLIRQVGDEVLTLQQKSATMSMSNVVAIVAMNCLMKCKALDYDELLLEVQWTMEALKGLGATMHDTDIKSSVDRILAVHRKIITMDREQRLRVQIEDLMEVSESIIAEMKGHTLKAETMATALPVIQLQMYVNPMLQYIMIPALVYLLVKRVPMPKDKIANAFNMIRAFMVYEFYCVIKDEKEFFDKAVEYCIQQRVIVDNNGVLRVGDAYKLQFMFEYTVLPYISTFVICLDVAIEIKRCDPTQLLVLIQERAEREAPHPYCLSLECISNYLRGLLTARGFVPIQNGPDIVYDAKISLLDKCRMLFKSVLPPLRMVWDKSNPVFEHRSNVPARL